MNMPMNPPETSHTRIEKTLSEAVRAIDAQFGDGFARDHPDLLASLVQSATIGTAVDTGRAAHEEALEAAHKISDHMAATLLKLKPKFFG